ncbi:uncharacterized protein LAESUDRAFT_644605 [Laetiporus sulphureus 93-53]|uniref:R3H domain-containing protein n=1 Tax=Laetiporus sulphureus 93-53 TaxID=1314785 RepID=A0A165GHC7_9APHY|nr:uncharacterized protein LAESUDRAFT_644605 [Laetiporus sulphureus 93-53]KZT10350.1 hypothetical protein LAESUDRAFT_644605 [Laetiporus sulphureus 93-53]
MFEHVVSAQAELDGKKPAAPRQVPKRSRRGGKFNSSLTESATAAFEKQEAKPSQKHRNAAPKADDLTSRLIRDLSTAPYPDCLICFAAIHPAQPTWSCSPSIPISAATDDEGDGSRPRANTAQCCWTTFHLKCIRAWASKSVKDITAAWRARGVEKKGEWRCPGCQAKREIVPSGYWCFCGSTLEPKLSRLATPHSCGNLCSRPRACGHPCPLACHPGPCPPCQVTLQLPCHCGKQMLSFRCSHLAPEKTSDKTAAELSCGQKCGHKLSCGNHDCEEICHPGPCPPCKVRHKARCYCGKEERELGCGEGEEKECAVMEEGQEKRWTGQFECGEICGRPFDCGIHTCSKPCHPPSLTPEPCPRSPSLVTHCPCGKHVLKPSSSPFFPPGTLLMRTSCTDPIPTCESNCMKPLEGCSHACSARCHTGPCPPCRIMVVRPCRCGATTRDVPCFEDQARGRDDPGVEEIFCDRPCTALRACGKHRCNRLCCPLASLASAAKGKGKKKAEMESAIVDEAGWHECDLVCGKLLSCGNHHCEQRDHRGACPLCLRSSFDEMICNCGRTILEPPIPCGTRISCHYPCARPPPPCGHPKAQHLCHEDPIPCPPCVFLTSKRCACGKKMVDNVKCSQEKVSCGTPCGKLLACGFHRCERLCHSDACGPCTAVCGKPRKLCLPAHHPCPLPCHAPAACSEAEPCRSIVTLTCPCGRIRQQVPCGRCTTNPTGREHSQQLKCSNECLVAKRNARLAEALGINPDRGTMHPVTYSDELLAFAKANAKFCTMVEKSLADFLSSDKKSQILAPMPEVRRKFVHDLAAVYRIDTQMVDQEPNRSVQLFRRIDSRLPAPLLSAAATVPQSSSSSPAFNLGKLADLRSPTVHQLPRAAAPPARSIIPPPTSGLGGWSAAVARPPNSASSSVWASRPVGSPPATRPSSAVSLPHPPHQAVTIAAHADEHVPDSWEDDA